MNHCILFVSSRQEIPDGYSCFFYGGIVLAFQKTKNIVGKDGALVYNIVQYVF